MPGLDNESHESYQRRRRRASGELVRLHGTWSNTWSQRLEKWVENLSRHPTCWVTRLLKTRDTAWISIRRSLFAIEGQPRRTYTRAICQYVHKRYEEGLLDWEKSSTSNAIQIPRLGAVSHEHAPKVFIYNPYCILQARLFPIEVRTCGCYNASSDQIRLSFQILSL